MNPSCILRRATLAAALLIGLSLSVAGWARTTTNTPPVITGSPTTTVEAGHAYTFTPQASDADGDRLTFTISNKPAWSVFNRRTGQLSGTPGAANVGVTSGILIQVSDRVSSAALAPFSITVTAGTPTNSAPVISGTPATTVRVGSPYSFLPTARDAEGDPLTFSIVNKPVWASFDPGNGALTGVPASSNVGTTTGITISVSDGISRTSLAPFVLSVVPANQATLSWVAPTARVDGTALSVNEIGGYRLYQGSSPDQLAFVVDVADATLTRYTITSLSVGLHYFAVTAYDASGVESAKSSVLSKTIQ